ncbi:MAG TPA: hypothetical protein VGX25_03245, partial [Actinophytocola sp.]|uniref:hypothetical protein n=1 Tax=Actinophytocola sp. TaxID=1872138 RepID=UPI002DDC954C
MRREDGRLLAQLILLDRQLPGIIEELLAGTLDGAEREALALTLTTIAAQLDPDLLLTDKATPGEPSRAQPNA